MAETTLTDDDKAVLRAMGLDEHSEFTVCRAGSGGPCIIQVDATRLGLSPELARRILTRPCDCPDAAHCAAPEILRGQHRSDVQGPGPSSGAG